MTSDRPRARFDRKFNQGRKSAAREAYQPSLVVRLLGGTLCADDAANGARPWPTPDDLTAFPLVDAGVDIFHCSQRRYWEPEFPGSELNLAGWTRRLSGKPTITVGSVTLSTELISTLMDGHTATPRSIHDLVERLERKEFDLVAIGRALITNPDGPKVVAAGCAGSLNPFAVSALAQLE